MTCSSCGVGKSQGGWWAEQEFWWNDGCRCGASCGQDCECSSCSDGFGESDASLNAAGCSIPAGQQACKPECDIWLKNYYIHMEELEAQKPDDPEEVAEELKAWAEFYCAQYERCCRGEPLRGAPSWTMAGAREDEERRHAEAEAEQERRDAERAAEDAFWEWYEDQWSKIQCGGPPLYPFSKKLPVKCSHSIWSGAVPQNMHPRDLLTRWCIKTLRELIDEDMAQYECVLPCSSKRGRGPKPKSCRKMMHVDIDGVDCKYYNNPLEWMFRDKGKGEKKGPPELDDAPDSDKPHPFPKDPQKIPDGDDRPLTPSGGRTPRKREFERENERRARQRMKMELERSRKWGKRMDGAGIIDNLSDVGGWHFIECEFDMSKVSVECVCEYEVELPAIRPQGYGWMSYAEVPNNSFESTMTGGGAADNPAAFVAAGQSTPSSVALGAGAFTGGVVGDLPMSNNDGWVVSARNGERMTDNASRVTGVS